METGEVKSLHATVEGRVQGVGFRYFVQDLAVRLQLTGWVRNRGDDKVEVYAEGSEEDLERLLSGLRRGPSSAMVINVQTEWGPALAKNRRFSILPTEY